MLHIKDIEAFAGINEALARTETPSDGARGEVIALDSRRRPAPPAEERAPEDAGCDIGQLAGIRYDFDFMPPRRVAKAGLFNRFLPRRRR